MKESLMRWQNSFTRLVGIAFGTMTLFMSAMVSVEIFSRKIFGFSMQGADEISGYIMAVMSCLAAAVAVVGRNHIRIDILHGFFSTKVRCVLNTLAIVSLAVLAGIIAYSSYPVLMDTIEYGSTAPTPLSTPLVYPMVPWFLALVVFAVISLIYAVRAVAMLTRGRWDILDEDYKPKAQKEEPKSVKKLH
jgi:TRAP-type C4-dicarboxylate transport system permease small subunit